MFRNVFELFYMRFSYEVCSFFHNRLAWVLYDFCLCGNRSNGLAFCVFLLFKSDRLTLYSFVITSYISKFVLFAILLFRTVKLPYSLLIWLIVYLSVGFTEKKRRKMHYLNILKNNGCCDRREAKIFNDIHATNVQKAFLKTVKEFSTKTSVISYEIIYRNETKNLWRKTFLPVRYFMIGLIYSCVYKLRIKPTSNATNW